MWDHLFWWRTEKARLGAGSGEALFFPRIMNVLTDELLFPLRNIL